MNSFSFSTVLVYQLNVENIFFSEVDNHFHAISELEVAKVLECLTNL